MDEKITVLIREILLKNAYKHGGVCNPKVVIGPVIQQFPDIKSKISEVIPLATKLSQEINVMSEDEQKKEIEQIDPEFFSEKKRNMFGFFHIAKGARVKTGFPPGPEKYPHLGHAKACLINYMLAKQYGGTFSLRFEDTNPKLVKKEFYDIILDNLQWLGVTWDELVYASDYMDLYRKYAEELIMKGQAFMCMLTQEESSKLRKFGKPSPYRNTTPEENMKLWKEFESKKEGEMVLRLKINPAHKNTSMRDPTIFRIIDHVHARHGSKYKAWPSYDFQNAIMDGYLKLTHRIRSSEFELRNELHNYIRVLFKLYPTVTYEIARFDVEGMPMAGRQVRELASKSEYGWYDPTLGTIVAMRRRGYTPEAIKQFVLGTGLTKNVSKIDLQDFVKINRRVLDETAKRYFFIENPAEYVVNNAPNKTIQLSTHPTEKRHSREFVCTEKYYLDPQDIANFKAGELVRLMDNLNFNVGGGYASESYNDFKNKGTKIIHFLSGVEGETVPVTVLMPDKTVVKGKAEKNILSLRVGNIIQFERFGFARLDAIENGAYHFWYTHK